VNELESINKSYIAGVGDGVQSIDLRKKHDSINFALTLYQNN